MMKQPLTENVRKKGASSKAEMFKRCDDDDSKITTIEQNTNQSNDTALLTT